MLFCPPSLRLRCNQAYIGSSSGLALLEKCVESRQWRQYNYSFLSGELLRHKDADLNYMKVCLTWPALTCKFFLLCIKNEMLNCVITSRLC